MPARDDHPHHDADRTRHRADQDADQENEGGGHRIGYVMKMYPRFSETFIVNEILAHEAAGTPLHLFSLRAPVDGRFHSSLAAVRAPVTYLTPRGVKATSLWSALGRVTRRPGGLGPGFDDVLDADAGDAAQALELAEAIDAHGITHLHAHFGSVATTVTRLASKLTGIPYTFTAHAKDIFHRDVDPDDLRAKLDDAATCVTVSDFNVEHLRRTFGPSAHRVTRIYNGLHLDGLEFTDPAHRAPRVVAVGRLVEKKGFADLIAACEQLAAAGRPVRCDIIGAGPLEDDLRRRIDRAGLADQVRLTGPLPQHRVTEVVGRAAVMVTPCVVGTDGNRDGLPTVLLEAMALGTPCVATPVTGIPELIEHDHTGLLVPEHDPTAIADAIVALADDPARRSRLARAGRERIETSFDVRRQAAALREVFAGAVSAGAVFADADRPETQVA